MHTPALLTYYSFKIPIPSTKHYSFPYFKTTYPLQVIYLGAAVHVGWPRDTLKCHLYKNNENIVFLLKDEYFFVCYDYIKYKDDASYIIIGSSWILYTII